MNNQISKAEAINLIEPEIVNKWKSEQVEFKKQLILNDTEQWQLNRLVYNENDKKTKDCLRFIAGLDISFVKDKNTACAGLFVFDISNDMELVYQDLDLIEMDQPYVPGFLAYREAPFLLDKLQKLKTNKPDMYPQCILIDGNGILHPHKFGMACHIGLLSDTPTIGVSKKLYQVFGLENNQEHKDKIKSSLLKRGDYFELKSNDTDELLAFCYRSTDDSPNPVYISIGNKISWATSLWVIDLCTKYRIPEPIRNADLITREYLRNLKLEKN